MLFRYEVLAKTSTVNHAEERVCIRVSDVGENV